MSFSSQPVYYHQNSIRKKSVISKNNLFFIRDIPLGAGIHGEANLFIEEIMGTKIVVKNIIFSKGNYDEFKEKIKTEQAAIKKVFGEEYGDIVKDTKGSFIELFKKGSSEYERVRLTMPYITGKTFKEYLKSINDPCQIVSLIMQVIEKAVAWRSRFNIIHGDPNQNNIIISGKTIHLIDLGEVSFIEKDAKEDFIVDALRKELLNFCNLLNYVSQYFASRYSTLSVFLSDLVRQTFEDQIDSIDQVHELLGHLYSFLQKSSNNKDDKSVISEKTPLLNKKEKFKTLELEASEVSSSSVTSSCCLFGVGVAAYTQIKTLVEQCYRPYL